LWAGAFSCCEVHPFLCNSARFLLTFMEFRQDLNVIPLVYRLAAGYPLCQNNTLDIKENNVLNFERFIRFLGGFGDNVDSYCIDFRLVSALYVNTQFSLQVIIEFNNSCSFSMLCRRSKHNSLRRSFCSSESSFAFLHKPSSRSVLWPRSAVSASCQCRLMLFTEFPNFT
jgi:hypothetical protein